MTKEDKELYEKVLAKHPGVDFILTVTQEEDEWIKQVRKKREKEAAGEKNQGLS